MPEAVVGRDVGVWPMLRSELLAVRRGDGPARMTGVCLIVIGLAVVAVRRFRDGAIATDVSSGLLAPTAALILPVLLLLLGPIRYLQRVEGGVERARHLAGIPSIRRRLTPFADCLWLVASALVTLLGTFLAVSGGADDPGRATGSRLAGILLNTAITGAALSVLTVALASVSRSTTAYLLVAVAILAVGLSLIWTARLGGVFTVLDQIWPTRQIPRLITPQQPDDWGRAAIAATICVTVAAAVIRWAPATDGGNVRRVRGARRHRDVPRALAWGAAAACWGLVVPALLADHLPWYARPNWINQVSSGRSSPDVAARWVTAVQSGTGAPDGLAAGTPDALAGPLLPTVHRLRASTAAVEYSPDSDPGTVTVQDTRNGVTTEVVYICLQPRASSWIVTGVRSAPDCPRTRP